MRASQRLSFAAAVLITLGATALASREATAQAMPSDIAPALGCGELESEAPGATFVALARDSQKWSGCNVARAGKPFLPASTFKVPHALIALETGVVADENAMVPWDGLDRGIPAWNKDTSLASGLTNSTVWFYQDLASKIGAARERDWLGRLSYGNQTMGPDEDLKQFWLTGQLRITAIQEVLFLERLLAGSLPASTENQARVRQMMLQGKPLAEKGWPLFAKSGAVLPINSDGELKNGQDGAELVEGLDRVGWYVGWVDRPKAEGGPIIFALNLDLSVPEAMAKRERLARQMIAASKH